MENILKIRRPDASASDGPAHYRRSGKPRILQKTTLRYKEKRMNRIQKSAG
jgi:hypothetical protein